MIRPDAVPGVERAAAPAAAPIAAASLWELVELRAAASPDAPMLVDERGRTLSFGQYRARAEQVAAGLLGRGVRAGSTVSWQLPTGMESAVLIAALARLGAVQNPVIPFLREHEVDLIVGQCAPVLIVVPTVWRGFDHRAMAESVAARHGSAVLVSDPATTSGDGGDGLALPLGEPAVLPPPPRPGPGDRLPVRWVFYSSGTTDRPKGVRHTDRALLTAGNNLRIGLGLRAGDLYPLDYPIAHIGGPAFLCAQLSVGSRVLLVERFDATASPPMMAEHRVTVLGSGLPFLLAHLAEQARRPEPMFPDLRIAAAGGSPIPPELHYAVKERLGGRGVSTAYGLTEFPVATCIHDDDGDEVMATTVGHPGPGVEVRIVDAAGVEAPAGTEGEVLLRGPQRFAGYVDAELDAAAFAADGFFRTGDLGILDGRGLLRITGRLKDVIIRNGENVSAAEVERALLQDADIADVAVIGIPDPRTGERVLAFVQPAGTGPVTMATVTRACRAAGLAPYKTPERLTVVAAIPRNSLGKILKTELRARASADLSPA